MGTDRSRLRVPETATEKEILSQKEVKWSMIGFDQIATDVHAELYGAEAYPTGLVVFGAYPDVAEFWEAYGRGIFNDNE